MFSLICQNPRTIEPQHKNGGWDTCFYMDS